jgi:hypothetical protein
MKTKKMSEKSAAFAKGGSNKMAGQSGAAPVVAGQVSLGGRSGDNKFHAKGGSGKMAGQSGAAPVVAGQVSLGGRSGDNMFCAKGGGKAMAGFTGSTTAKPR